MKYGKLLYDFLTLRANMKKTKSKNSADTTA